MAGGALLILEKSPIFICCIDLWKAFHLSKTFLCTFAILCCGMVHAGPRFSDATLEAGIDFAHVNGANGQKFVIETVGPGGGLFDYDGDGRLDIYLVNGAAVPGTECAVSAPEPAVCRARIRGVRAQTGRGRGRFARGRGGFGRGRGCARLPGSAP